MFATAARGGRPSSAPLTPPRASFALICPRRSTANRSRATARASNSIVASTGSSSRPGRYTRGARPVRSHPAMEANDHEFVRRVNLIESLCVDVVEGQPRQVDSARAWTEAQIRAYFASRGATSGSRTRYPIPRRVPVRASVPRRADRWRASDGRVRVPAPDDTTFRRWFPGLRRSGTRVRRRRPADDARAVLAKRRQRRGPIHQRTRVGSGRAVAASRVVPRESRRVSRRALRVEARVSASRSSRPPRTPRTRSSQ